MRLINLFGILVFVILISGCGPVEKPTCPQIISKNDLNSISGINIKEIKPSDSDITMEKIQHWNIQCNALQEDKLRLMISVELMKSSNDAKMSMEKLKGAWTDEVTENYRYGLTKYNQGYSSIRGSKSNYIVGIIENIDKDSEAQLSKEQIISIADKIESNIVS